MYGDISADEIFVVSGAYGTLSKKNVTEPVEVTILNSCHAVFMATAVSLVLNELAEEVRPCHVVPRSELAAQKIRSAWLFGVIAQSPNSA
jgi:hypothetical protein